MSDQSAPDDDAPWTEAQLINHWMEKDAATIKQQQATIERLTARVAHLEQTDAETLATCQHWIGEYNAAATELKAARELLREILNAEDRGGDWYLVSAVQQMLPRIRACAYTKAKP